MRFENSGLCTTYYSYHLGSTSDYQRIRLVLVRVVCRWVLQVYGPVDRVGSILSLVVVLTLLRGSLPK
jgi:hypothetical protein